MIKATDSTYPFVETGVPGEGVSEGINVLTYISTQVLKGIMGSESPDFINSDAATTARRSVLFAKALIEELNKQIPAP